MEENEQGKKTTFGSPDSRIGTRWIYTLRKDELLIFAQEFGFDGTGKVDEMRRRLAEIVKAGELSPSQRARMARLETGFANVGANDDVKRVEEDDLDPRSIQLQVPGFFTPRGGSPVDRKRAVATEGATSRINTKSNLTQENEMGWGGSQRTVT